MPGRILVTLMVSLVVAAAWHVLGEGSAAAESNLPSGWVATPYGPLSPADSDFLVRVRQAGLWEMPAGQMAQTQAESNTVKTVGATLQADHHLLDDQVRKLAAQLNVTLPAEPNKDQQGWLAEMSGQYGTAFDRTFANRLRAAHGKVFTVVAAVRAGTRNDLIRGFAQTAVEVVMKHMTLLESTGNVDYNALPPPSTTTGTGSTPGPESNRFLSGSTGALVFLGLAAVLLLAIALSRRSRPRRRVASW
jgi:predicted outer membrane protein